ncbi:MAG: hypothetical protein ACFCVK_16655 [Acidimicrobiales bacterium]
MTTGDWNTDPSRIERNWRAITFELDAPRPGRIERLLRLAGIPAHVTRLMVATPALRRAWFVAIGLAMVLGLGSTGGASDQRDSLFTLLLVAPLVPVLGVSFAYGIEADPAHEVAVATPMRGLRLIVTRAAVVLAVSSVFLAVVAVLAPGRQPMAFAWLLPSLGLTTATVALMTRFSPRRSAVIAGAVWVVGVLAVTTPASDRLAAFAAPTQLVMAIVTAAGLAIVWNGRESYDRLEGRP